MSKAFLAALLFPATFHAAASEWILDHSTLTYRVAHPLHRAQGVSKQATGHGSCQAGTCSFLIDVPVKSFDSGNTGRDSRMLQITRAAQFPLVRVRTQVQDSAAASSTLTANLEIEFSGQTVHYKQVPFELMASGSTLRLTGTIPATLSDFKIEPPRLLAVPLKNEVPVQVDMTWRSQ